MRRTPATDDDGIDRAPRPAPADGQAPPGATDAELLRDCRWEAFRGPGPGGQKRNKTSSAVRVMHEPSGLSAIAGESRSQHANRTTALARLKHRMALEIRRPVAPDGDALPHWFVAVLAAGGGRLRVGRRRPEYLAVVAFVLDVFLDAGCAASGAAARLGLTTANLVDFFQRDDHLLAQVNRLRAARGLRSLGSA